MKGYFINAETRRNYECEYIYEFEYWRFTIARNQADYDRFVKKLNLKVYLKLIVRQCIDRK